MQKQQVFGKVDPFCAFAVVPLLSVAGLFIWSEIAILGVALVFLTVVVVVVDSWANRPVKANAHRDREDY